MVEGMGMGRLFMMSFEGKIKFALCKDKVSKVFFFFFFFTYFWLVRYHVAVGVVKLFGLCRVLVCLIFAFVWGVILN